MKAKATRTVPRRPMTAQHTAAAAAAVIATAAAAAAVVVADAGALAAKVIASAATDAAAVKEASGDHDALIALRAEVNHQGITNAANHQTILAAVGEVKAEVVGVQLEAKLQNGRTGKLETWKAQVVAVGVTLLAAQSFLLWALSKWT